jgi:hypothetical protein
VIGAEAGNLAFEELTVGFVDLGDLVAVDDEDAALAVLGFLEAQRPLFASEERIVGPGGADDEAVALGGGHGRKRLS